MAQKALILQIEALVSHTGLITCNVVDDSCSPEMVLQPLAEEHLALCRYASETTVQSHWTASAFLVRKSATINLLQSCSPMAA